ncbi:sigma factor-like helix-turn-helix DNA-binding protein [Altererythrobacter arenosus]|uniref:Sigma factor-like helix-turn-helix DNA-binding protein n=1 Tax=Altererythrobacter arenosus TaxID=3032592 RepID=A0ABY8FPR5_9SPHN|nr:sigma factor-like helix-turn-helix DNA-binding protein [Altererythrobacter sp. CAU 1644]WFL76832.1 sigma factor-like helix-turn-helix DNA-binding protein [Altererythrobacter sp. CAU 1644]
MTEDQFTEITSKIDTLIKIQALSAVAHLPTKSEKVLFLNDAGLTPKEIAAVVGGSSGAVSQTIYAAKKKAEKQ